LDTFNNKPTTKSFEVDGLKINLSAINYKQFTDFNLREYALQRRIVSITRDTAMTKAEQDKETKDILDQMARLNLELAVAHIYSLESENEKETNQSEIYTFIAQTDTKFFKGLKDAVATLKKDWDLPALDVTCVNEDCSKQYKTSLNLDYSSFFAVRR
jgi:hypothetical protein